MMRRIAWPSNNQRHMYWLNPDICPCFGYISSCAEFIILLDFSGYSIRSRDARANWNSINSRAAACLHPVLTGFLLLSHSIWLWSMCTCKIMYTPQALDYKHAALSMYCCESRYCVCDWIVTIREYDWQWHITPAAHRSQQARFRLFTAYALFITPGSTGRWINSSSNKGFF